jgi:hypothetical protein
MRGLVKMEEGAVQYGHQQAVQADNVRRQLPCIACKACPLHSCCAIATLWAFRYLVVSLP